uniref:Uncharacterized protein n=1 Tax=Clytia hemisphaerica TaxID=252671 RepID=A0A7M6DQC9_9CNID
MPSQSLIQDAAITSNTETEADVDSATENKLLETTEPSESEVDLRSTPRLAASPLKNEELLQFRLNKNKYSFDDINSYKYWREVRTIIGTNMGRREKLTFASYLTFDDHFEG